MFCAGVRFGMRKLLGLEPGLSNFRAFLAFLGVNAASFHHYYVRGRDRRLGQGLVPLIGAAVCLYIWWSLRWQAKLAGFAWVAVGTLYFALRRSGQPRHTL